MTMTEPSLKNTPKLALRVDSPALDRLFDDAFRSAAASFSSLIQKDYILAAYRVDTVRGESFPDLVGDEMEESYFASIVKVRDALCVHVVCLMSEGDGRQVYRSIGGDGVEKNEEMIAGIGELTNIVGSTFINGLANHLGQTIHGTPPVTTFDMLGAILESLVLQDEFLRKQVLCADAIIQERGKGGFNIRLLILMDREQMLRLVEGC